MRAVKAQHTKPEMRVRSLVHRLGYRFRLHAKHLPGAPDLVFPARRAVIFVHGCFWHGHTCPRGARAPKTNIAYWQAKIARNRQRDAEHRQALADLNYRVLTVWECELKTTDLSDVLTTFLGPPGPLRTSSAGARHKGCPPEAPEPAELP